MVVQRRNHRKVINYVRAKAQCEWDKVVIIAEQCPPLPKLNLVKLALKQLLQVLGLNVSSMGNMLQNTTSGWKRMKIYKR
jgi:hypothetical protein